MENILTLNGITFKLEWKPVTNGYTSRLDGCEELTSSLDYANGTREDIIRRAFATAKAAAPEDFKFNFYFNPAGKLSATVVCMKRFTVDKATATIFIPHLGVNLRTLQAVALQQNMPEKRVWRIVWETNGSVVGEIRVK